MTDATGILVVDKSKDSMPDVKIISFPERKRFKILLSHQYPTKNIDIYALFIRVLTNPNYSQTKKFYRW